MSGSTYYQRNREVMLNRAKRYYHDNVEVLREKAKNKFTELSEKEKNIKREYGRNRYHNMTEEKKQRLKEYQKIIVRLKNIFQRYRYGNKGALQDWYQKDVFYLCFYQFSIIIKAFKYMALFWPYI